MDDSVHASFQKGGPPRPPFILALDVKNVGIIKNKSKNQNIWIINKLDKFERLNHEELKFLSNGVVKGLAPVDVAVKRHRCILSVKLANQMTAADYCRESMDTATILTILSGTLQIALECERRGLRPDNLCWDENDVFLDLDSGKICMLYWPVIRLNRADQAILRFYQNFLNYMIRDNIDSSVINAYSTFFYQRDTINLFSFEAVVRKIQENWKRAQEANTLEIRQNSRAAVYEYHRASGIIKGNAWLESSVDTRKVWLNREKVVLGRSKQESDVVISNDASVSRCHAQVIRQGDKYYLEDLQSKNGTFLEEQRLKPYKPKELTDGMQVRLGDSCFTFRMLIDRNTIPIYQLIGGKK